MSNPDTPHPDAEKWNRIYATAGQDGCDPALVLRDYLHLLPEQGRALDLACGRGGNAVVLAKLGLDTSAWDISSTVISRLAKTSRNDQLGIKTEIRDVVSRPPAPGTFDVITVSRFLERKLVPRLIEALRPRGLIYYQTFIREKTGAAGPGNPDYLLEPNELLELFRPLRIILYREEGNIGKTDKGFRNEAMLIAQKD